MFAAALCASSLGATASGPAIAVDCTATGLRDLWIAESSATTLLVASDAQDAVLQIEEAGRELSIRIGGASTAGPVGARPPRLGIDYLRAAPGATLQIEPAAKIDRPAPVRWQLHCGADARLQAFISCAAEARRAESSDEDVEVPSQEPACVALVQHAAATRSSRAGRYAESIERYGRAIAQWRNANDRPREAAALLGLAEQLRRIGRFQDALDAALESERLAQEAGVAYFAARAKQDACLSLQALGRSAEARNCVQRLPELFEALGETAEQANAFYNVGSIAEEEGRLQDATLAASSALALDRDRVTPLAAGRLHALVARIAMRNGRFQDAIVALDLAAHAFDRAGDARWRANNDLVTAHVMLALGDATQARLLAERAHASFVELLAPARIAAAELVLALAAESRGDLPAAIALSSFAAERFRQARMPLRSLQSELVAVRAGEASAARRVGESLGTTIELPDSLIVDRDLALAEFNLRRGRLEDMYARLSSAARHRPDLLDSFELIVAQSRYDIARGNATAAFVRLDAGIERMRALGLSLASASLRHVLGTRLEMLRSAWVDAWAASPPSQRPSPKRVWRMIALTEAASLAAPAQGDPARATSEADSLERAIAASLVSLDADRPEDLATVSREMLTYQAMRESAAPRATAQADAPPLGLVRSTLREDEMLVALALGRDVALRLTVTKSSIAVDGVGSAPVLLEEAARLRESLALPTVPVARIAERARVLGARLFDGLGAVPPRRLLLFGSALGRLGPASVLQWPGRDEPLVASSATSLVPTWVSANRAESAPTRVEVFTSSGGVGGPLALPPLYNAERESSWIAGLSGLAAVERNGTSFNRENLRAALAAADAWVHVAAHGMTRSDLVGQSGLVLAPSDGGKVPTFISWFEIAESRITAPLVVLNACDLGAPSRDARTPETAFAMALAAAGAPNTVAAMWPVSDSAASVWVPAFYGTMTRERDPAVAVREAQLQLRAGRAYRHPYYWAALVHLTQLERPKRSSR